MRAPRDDSDSAYAESLLRLVTAFASTIAGAIVLHDISEALACAHPVLSAELLDSDMQFVLGEHNAGVLRTLFQSFPRDYHGVRLESGLGTSPELPNSFALCEKIVAEMRRDQRLTAIAEEYPWESVGKVFLGLRGATDSPELRRSDPSTSRMKVGLNYSSIRIILADEFGVEITPEEIGLAVDMFVDRGLAVPKITEENGVLSRTMYCGEDEEDQPTLQLKSALHASYSSFANPKKGRLLSFFDLQKICTVLKSLIPDLPITAGPSVKSAKACFEELTSAIHEYIPKYDDTEFPFAPDLRNRPLADGRIERRRENVFMLTLDIIKGTNSEQTNQMKEEVRNTFRRFEESGLVFEDTGNDSFIAIADDPLVLWDVAKSLALKGEALKATGGRFSGTPKALYFGSVAVIEKPDGNRVIRDVRIPNDVPRAFYVLDGVDEYVEENRRNQFLAIEKSTLGRCAGRLAIDVAKLVERSVEAKHFSGTCYLTDLS